TQSTAAAQELRGGHFNTHPHDRGGGALIPFQPTFTNSRKKKSLKTHHRIRCKRLFYLSVSQQVISRQCCQTPLNNLSISHAKRGAQSNELLFIQLLIDLRDDSFDCDPLLIVNDLNIFH